ncbi:restriction endonuclease subunit S [Patescibacteria group bacterium]|nr:restriction endonuclease subunit S [Patescibacteria group bacterium]MBU4057164.1 restriction endonuclease subunit S [Patescibacteria group bacterium]MBU4369108.1 restriction endonuclease subunit S [Patescibacteria group bacterium]
MMSSKIKIPLPPLKIQKQIVERLDKIIVAQKLNDELIQKADELYRSLLHNELNAKLKNQKSKLPRTAKQSLLRGKQFKIKKLGEVAEVTSIKRIYQSEYVEIGIPFYRTKEIVELSQNKPVSLELFISEKRFNEINEKFGVPERGDILISAVGTIGISWVVPDNRKFYFKDGNLLWIKNLKDVDPIYLEIVLENFAKNISKLGVGGAYNALTIIKLKKVQIPVPSLKIQKQIVAKLSASQDYKKQLVEQKNKLKELFESVLHKALNN